MKTTRVICVDCHRISILDNAIITTCPYCNSSHIEMEAIHKPDPAWLNVIGYAKLNPEQQKIVLSTEGLNYVSAGPGTAKSTTLAVRARYIVHQRRDNLHTPLILTFTNQAVERLTASFLNLRQQDRPQVDTIHGFAYKLLNRYRDHLPEHFKHFRVMNENDSIQIFERIRSIDPAICGTLSDTELVQTIQQYKRTSSYISSLMKETVCQEPFLHCYTQCQREFGILDFDDLIRVAVYLKRTSSRVAVMIQEQCKYVLVDESQDLTDAELELLDLISARYRNLFLVGDEDQSIYGWRGASNRAFSWLESLNLKIHIFSLINNYRSSQAILNIAKILIDHAPTRLPKKLVAVHPKGVKVFVKACRNPEDEAKIIAASIELVTDSKSVPHALHYSDIAVLARNRSSLKMIRKVLAKKKIPVNETPETPLLQAPVVSSVIRYLTFLARPDDITFAGLDEQIIPEEYWEAFCARTAGGAVMDVLNLWYTEGKPVTERGMESLKLLNESNNLLLMKRPNCITNVIENVIGFIQPGNDSKELSAFIGLTRKLSKRHLSDLSGFLDAISLVGQEEAEFQHAPDRVHLLTLHAAKGKEFKKVFICGATARFIPAPKGNIEEERRLLYVGITRAQDELTISYPINSFGQPEEPSPFLREILTTDSAIFSGEPEKTHQKKRNIKPSTDGGKAAMR